jgi:hypothetical protein
VILAAAAAPVELSVEVAQPRVETGSPVDVRVAARARRDVEVTGVEIALVARMRFIHREAGMLGPAAMSRSTRTEVHSVHEVPGPWPLAAGESVTLPARLAVPETAPGTTRSDLIDIAWSVRMRLNAVGHTYAQARSEIVVLSAAPDRLHVAMSPPAAESRGIAALAFEDLSSRVLVAGRPLAGTLVLAPQRATTARSVRVAILMRQQVHRGEWVGDDPSRNPAYRPNERSAQIAAATVADALELVPGRDVRLPFTLPVRPALRAPSLGTPTFAVRWVLRGEVDRGLHRRPFVELELHGRTTRQ